MVTLSHKFFFRTTNPTCLFGTSLPRFLYVLAYQHLPCFHPSWVFTTWFLHSPSAPRSSCSLNCFYEPNFMYINLGAHLSRSMINHRSSVGRPPHFHLVSLVLQVVVRPNDSQEVERGTTHKKYTPRVAVHEEEENYLPSTMYTHPSAVVRVGGE